MSGEAAWALPEPSATAPRTRRRPARRRTTERHSHNACGERNALKSPRPASDCPRVADVRAPEGDGPAMAKALAVFGVVGTLLCELSLLADLSPDDHRLLVMLVSSGGLAFAAGIHTL